jgi:hypothetical protein
MIFGKNQPKREGPIPAFVQRRSPRSPEKIAAFDGQLGKKGR